MTVKLSKTSKLGTYSWSLQAVETCPGSARGDGTLVDACRGCYARTGNYRFANVKAPRLFNREDWQRADWVPDMVNALQHERYFRWFDSGDCYDVKLADKMLAIMQALPDVKFWFPTRMHKFAKFRVVLDRMQALPNVVVRFSSDSVTGETVAGATTSTIVPTPTDAPKGSFVCPAYTRGGKCESCRQCYDKGTAVIAYPAHGVSMAKVIRLAVAA
jgi:hypothetical protein